MSEIVNIRNENTKVIKRLIISAGTNAEVNRVKVRSKKNLNI